MKKFCHVPFDESHLLLIPLLTVFLKIVHKYIIYARRLETVIVLIQNLSLFLSDKVSNRKIFSKLIELNKFYSIDQDQRQRDIDNEDAS